jgi:hypothetical protein
MSTRLALAKKLGLLLLDIGSRRTLLEICTAGTDSKERSSGETVGPIDGQSVDLFRFVDFGDVGRLLCYSRD